MKHLHVLRDCSFQRAVLAGVVAALVGCGGGGDGDVSGPTSTPEAIAGLAAHGAPIVEGVITVYDVKGAIVSTQTSTALGAWSLSVSKADEAAHPFPWIIKGQAAGAPTVWSIVFADDIGATGQSVNLNPFTAAVLAAVGINIGDGTLDASDLLALKSQTSTTFAAAGSVLSGTLTEAFAKMPSAPQGNVFEKMRTTPFWGTSIGLDAVLDSVVVQVATDGKINIAVPAISASFMLDPAATSSLPSQVVAAKATIVAAVNTSGELLGRPPTLIAFDTQSSWGTATDSWAGFTGAATVLPAKDYGTSAVIKFKSKGFPAAGWLGTSASYDSATSELTLTLPAWTTVAMGGTYSLGFNGTASKAAFEAAVKTATGCRINGDPCVIAFGPASATDKGTLSTAAYFSSFGKFYVDTTATLEKVVAANVDAGTQTSAAATAAAAETATNKSGGGVVDSSASSKFAIWTTAPAEPASAPVVNAAAASYLVTVSADGFWYDGFNGRLTVKNTSSATVKDWSVSLPVALGAFSGRPEAWNGNFAYSNGVLTITPSGWAKKSLAAGESWTTGFKGGRASEWLAVANTAATTFKPGSGLIAAKTVQTAGNQSVVAPIPPINVPTVPKPKPPATTSAPITIADGTQNWQKDPGTTGATATAANPCSSVRWGSVKSVGSACLALMDAKSFGGPKHSGAADQISLSNGKPDLEAFGYLVEWSIYGRKFGVENVAAAQYSKILYSFLRVLPDGTLMVADTYATMGVDDTGTLLGLDADPFSSAWENQDRGTMKRLTMLKARFPHLKTAFSIGGWTLSGQFSSVAADPVKRANLIKSSIAFANKFGFDGIDIDWEYPVVGGNLVASNPGASNPGAVYAEANPGLPSDATNYTALLKELKTAITNGGADTARSRTKSGKIEVSIAVGLGPRAIDAVNYADFIDYVDTVNLMAYDFNGSWSSVVSHNAPLYDNKGLTGPKLLSGSNFDQSEWNNHDAVLNILWNLKNQQGKALRADGELGKLRFHKGDNGSTTQASREALMTDATLANYRKKLVLGVPFYGRIWSSNATLAAGDVSSPWFTGSAASIGSLESGVADSKDVIYARDGKTDRIRANGRASLWPATAIAASDIHWDPIACASFVKTAGNIVSFDDEDAIYHKAKYVKDNGLGGVMVWEVDGDTYDAKLSKSFVAGLSASAAAPLGKSCTHH